MVMLPSYSIILVNHEVVLYLVVSMWLFVCGSPPLRGYVKSHQVYLSMAETREIMCTERCSSTKTL